jgi:hypothetical protein
MIDARNIQKTKEYNNLIWYVKIYFVEQQWLFYPGGLIFCWVLVPLRQAQDRLARMLRWAVFDVA